MASVAKVQSKEIKDNGRDDKGSSTHKPVRTNRRVMICCVTFETVKLTEPIEYVGAERAHILHWGEPGTVYADFHEEAVRVLTKKGVQMVDFEVFRFKAILEKLISIMTGEGDEGNDVCLNLSAGTMEFAVAATIASMIPSKAIL